MQQAIENRHPAQTTRKGIGAISLLIALAFAGGFADAAAYLLTGSFAGHITGNTVLGALALGGGRIGALEVHVVALAAFIVATGAGILLLRRGPGTNSTLVLALVIEAVLVGVAPLTGMSRGSHTDVPMLVLLSLALGLQNGVFSKDKGVAVHTTYITGDVTSLLVSVFKKPGDPASGKSPGKHTTDTMLGTIWPSFAAGALAAGVAVHFLREDALWWLEVPLLLAIVLAGNSMSEPVSKA